MRSDHAATALNPQDGLYTLIQRKEDGPDARIIGSIRKVHALPDIGHEIINLMTHKNVRIISLTITEKGYYIDQKTKGLDVNNIDIIQDIKGDSYPKTAPGLLVSALERCRTMGRKPFTILSCDNLADNGKITKQVVCDFAKKKNSGLAKWIEETVLFPSTVVDRITPAPTGKTLSDALMLNELSDNAPVETEIFSQWVIEDNFSDGRPDWDKAGAIFTSDVSPYEIMKLRMLNGTHSMLAYSGLISGKKYVRDVMADPIHAQVVHQYLNAVKNTINPIREISLDQYGIQLCDRFSNKVIAHETKQIVMDGTQKIPQRIISPAHTALAKGQDIDMFAFAIASWMRYCTGRNDMGVCFTVIDPRSQEITTALKGENSAHDIYSSLSNLSGLFPQKLAKNELWSKSVISYRSIMLENDMHAALNKTHKK